ncbi:hypothetical protein Scep_006005 [Stephania cephalantha]|uniref:Uncharacterized protein n=1 Tax=Stephania cephalantha TaxID=152367 RepID=A0AAP0PJP1_9MAGN
MKHIIHETLNLSTLLLIKHKKQVENTMALLLAFTKTRRHLEQAVQAWPPPHNPRPLRSLRRRGRHLSGTTRRARNGASHLLNQSFSVTLLCQYLLQLFSVNH